MDSLFPFSHSEFLLIHSSSFCSSPLGFFGWGAYLGSRRKADGAIGLGSNGGGSTAGG